MKALAEAGCDTTATSSDGTTPLMQAAMSGSAEAVRAVLELGGAELEAKDQNGATAFLYACSKGNVECMKALAEAAREGGLKI